MGLALWLVARVAGLTAYALLAAATVTGLGLRSSILQSVITNRGLRETHTFAALLWVPLAALHVGALLLDQTARLNVSQALVPFSSAYATFGLGLGALSLDLVVLVMAAGLLRARLPGLFWRWVHRLAYVAFAACFLHSLLTGTDVANLLVSALVCALAAAVGVLSLSRLIWGRLGA